MAPFFSLLDAQRHDREAFDSGEPTLDAYLRERAGQHQRDGIATTHVLADDRAPVRILGYCSLAAAQLNLADLREADRSRLPRHPVPAVRIGRLAVDRTAQGRGIGRLLLGHAMNGALALRKQLGVRVLIVDALHENAAAFYRLHGFRATTADAMTLCLPLGKG
jgi:GNAT superfamily N-acetyltransferase